MPTIKISWKQARMLGIAFCECGHPANNHYEHDDRPCAHCPSTEPCKKLREGIYLPRVTKK